MAGAGNVLVDTSAWIDYFAGDAAVVRLVDALISDDRIVLCGQVRLELLQGTRDDRAFATLVRKLSVWTYEAETPDDFRAAALLYARLRWKGVTIPTSDCLIAAVAQRRGLSVYASDPHFSSIPDLPLFALSR